MTHQVQMRKFSLCTAAFSMALTAAMLSACCTAVWPMQDTERVVTSLQTASVSFPERISCTAMTVENLASYTGIFYEDGQIRQVFDVAAVVVYNGSESILPYGQVTLHTENRTYRFDGYMLPPDSYTLIPEKNAQPNISEPVLRVTGWSTVQTQHMPDVTVTEAGMGRLQVKNTGYHPLPQITVFHKLYLPDSDLYMGGVAFRTQCDALLPGQTAWLLPENYASGYSRVVHVERASEYLG